MGSKFRLTQHRGELIEGTPWAPFVISTVHPSAVLRMPDHDARVLARKQFVAELKIVAGALSRRGRKASGRRS